MTRRERLMATLRGEPVDRPPVCFYEIDGYTQQPDNPDPFNIFNHPSWKPLLELTREKSDRIILRGVPFVIEKTPAADSVRSVWSPETQLEAEAGKYSVPWSGGIRTSIPTGRLNTC